MIEFMQESRGNIVGVRASGKLTGVDYKRSLIPHLESLINQHRRLRVLFFMDEAFAGWDLEAAWNNTVLDFCHRSDFEKIAMVGAPAWEEWCVKLAGFLMQGELRTFRREQLPEAWQWIRT